MFPLDPATAADLRVQVVVAHPDDETFGCGSLLLHAHAAGASTAVVCATRGEAGEVAAGVEVPGGDLAALREGELRAAAELLGVSRVDLLGYGDSGMAGEPTPGTLAGADPRDVAQAVATAVTDFGPDVLVSIDGSDGHRDHARIRNAVLEVGRERGSPVCLVCIPKSMFRRWADHMQQVDPDSTYLHLGELGTPDKDITTTVDVSEHLAGRWEAIRAHRSQTSPFAALPDDLATDLLSQDFLIEIP